MCRIRAGCEPRCTVQRRAELHGQASRLDHPKTERCDQATVGPHLGHLCISVGAWPAAEEDCPGQILALRDPREIGPSRPRGLGIEWFGHWFRLGLHWERAFGIVAPYGHPITRQSRPRPARTADFSWHIDPFDRPRPSRPHPPRQSTSVRFSPRLKSEVPFPGSGFRVPGTGAVQVPGPGIGNHRPLGGADSGDVESVDGGRGMIMGTSIQSPAARRRGSRRPGCLRAGPGADNALSVRHPCTALLGSRTEQALGSALQ